MASVELLGQLQQNVANVRNICILAHVDHGKTTLSDSLISSNGLISARSAGKVRYLDSREDEQRRFITMKSSNISLYWKHPSSGVPYLINLIDSPGHVDFSSEVSTAVRLCDGALVLVDAVEGVGPQTRAVIRQAWKERVKTTLVINKMDRLILDLRLSPSEAYTHLCKIIEQVNALQQQLLTEEVMAAAAQRTKGSTATASAADDTASVTSDGSSSEADSAGLDLVFDDDLEESIEFSPVRGNVVFASALHGWCFDIATFARQLAPKLGVKPTAVPKLQRALWGDYFFNPKTKQVLKRAQGKLRPMCVQFILESLWKVYEVTVDHFDPSAVQKMVTSLKLTDTVKTDALKQGPDAAQAIISAWLPLSQGILSLVSALLPSPTQAASLRMAYLCPSLRHDSHGGLAQTLMSSSAQGECVAYVAKFLGADLDQLTLTGDKLMGIEKVGDFVGFARVFAGTLRKGMDLRVCGGVNDGAVDGADTDQQRTRIVRVLGLYLLMGRYLSEINEVPAGSICALSLADASTAPDGDNHEHEWTLSLTSVDRCITLSTTDDCPPFDNPYSKSNAAIVRVSVEPKHLQDFDAVARGLRLLQRADPSVELSVLDTGEYVIGCCGEVHLERCINDLSNLYARVPLNVSPPLVAIRESITSVPPTQQGDTSLSEALAKSVNFPPWATDRDKEKEKEKDKDKGEEDGEGKKAPPAAAAVEIGKGSVRVETANRRAVITLRAEPLPPEVVKWLDDNEGDISAVIHGRRPALRFLPAADTSTSSPPPTSSDADDLNRCLDTIGQEIHHTWTQTGIKEPPKGRLWGICVNRGSRNLLLGTNTAAWSLRHSYGRADTQQPAERDADLSTILPSVVSGFELASYAGPICEEAVRGVGFVVQDVRLKEVEKQVSDDQQQQGGQHGGGGDGESSTEASGPIASDPYGPFSGQVMSATKEGCRESLLQRGRTRICEAALRLEMQCEQDVLGKAYGVLAKRRARVVAENLREGTSTFVVEALIPVTEAFGVAQDLRSRASGDVSLHLQFSHWEVLDEDPFPEASMTEEELEEFGEQGPPPNTARRIVTTIRKRKGLATGEKVVVAAEKQRTLTRNK
ncbi:unnamed protein product [Vitrella brassicaformis CCMP3155]|uniref:Tr-type G domain-containing protein n=3 Tax=Vitrella brassicaformis TaxID=1169539 RepID=A0A0G4EFL8_VITBC|nr:unnamed protein product [Vitrella brassicaformis CCMP3155]|eukprot:CEL94296.1 unnamed protein product [Vitrella brassicaformis CCMP3155]